MAAKQQSEKLDLRDRQKKEREKLKKKFLRQFPSFKAWLSLDDDPELFALYRYPGQLVLFAPESGERFMPGQQQSFDLRDYSPIFGERRDGVMYCKKGKTLPTSSITERKYSSREIVTRQPSWRPSSLPRRNGAPSTSTDRKSTNGSVFKWRHNTTSGSPTRN
jgi:hypothetical protein